MINKLKFIDLFAGIGGFHQALSNLGASCVFACEIDEYASRVYEKNYKIKPFTDITKLKTTDIPKYDILCAGFPCQAFSKAGNQLGFLDKTKGTLFFEVARILKDTSPKYLILENVANLLTHNNKDTINTITKTLDYLGYNIKIIKMSSHQLKIPQTRERVYIFGVKKEIYNYDLEFQIPFCNKDKLNIYDSNIIQQNADAKYNITNEEKELLSCWDEFYKNINLKTIGFPIWVDYFNNNQNIQYPQWKQKIIDKNNELYNNNKVFIDNWLKKWNYLRKFTNTQRKFEWQAGESISSIWDGVIQLRPSGIRVKKPTTFPTLVAMVQIPIIARFQRRLTPREAARLQNFNEDFIIDKNDFQAYKQFGNAVNVRCVEFLAKQFFDIILTKNDKNKTNN